MRLVHLIISTFTSLKIIADALIDVRNETLKTHNLAFRYECSSPFQGTAASKVQLTTAHG